MADSIGDDKSSPAVPDEVAPTPVPPEPHGDSRAKAPHLLVLLTLGAVAGVGSLMLLASATRAPVAETESAASVTRPSAAPAAVTPADVEPLDTTTTPKWVASVPSRSTGFGQSIVFELAADRDVDVWRKRARPVLTVRCTAGTTEAFVVTQSPASIESNSNQHTITLSFDDGQPVEQMWEHSVDHDALFALDGRKVTRQIAAARSLSFTFAPFNAPLATATFSTAGLDAKLKSAGRKCAA